MGLLYPCFCTRADIARERRDGAARAGRAALSRHLPRAWMPRARAARIERAACLAARHGARRRARAGPLRWHGRHRRRRQAADPAAFGDVVLARKDAPASYHLAVTVDDAAQGVTDVVRGDDLFAATHVHRLLQALLGLPTPRLSPSSAAASMPPASAWPSATARRRCSDLRARRRGRRARWRTICAAGRLPVGFSRRKAIRVAHEHLPRSSLLVAAMIATVVALVRGVVNFLRNADAEVHGGTSGPARRASNRTR